jgi:signal transduction histidine kinase
LRSSPTRETIAPIAMWRADADGQGTVVGTWPETEGHPVEIGMRRPLAELEDAVPIVVDGALWGVVSVLMQEAEAGPSRVVPSVVAEAVARAIATSDAVRLADEQAALRSVAVRVAEGAPPEELFAAVTEEVGRLFGADAAGMIRYERDAVISVGDWDRDGEGGIEVGSRWPMDGSSLAPRILRSGEPARIDDWSDVTGRIAEVIRTRLGFTSSVGAPIVVEGSVWGTLFVHSKRSEPLPAGTEQRLASFAELVATAILNAQAGAELRRLAADDAALRRVATLVARESPPPEVFAAVVTEIGKLLGVEDTALLRYEEDGTATVVARWGRRQEALPIGARLPVKGHNVTALVRETSRPARIDDYRTASGDIGARLHDAGTRSAVGSPIVVEDRLWGVMVAAQGIPEPLPAETEARLARFAELTATALANAQAREDLAASRARIVAAADQERRRVVRDLHDGAQQRLVHALMILKMAQRDLKAGGDRASGLLDEAVEHAELAIGELRELAHGNLPAVHMRGGLSAGVRSLAQRSQVPIDVTVTVDRLPAVLEATAYFVISEALTNVAKHAQATRVTVRVHADDESLHVEVRDNGVGGARLDGAGLGGLADRAAALNGRLQIESPPGGGTRVVANLPLGA